MTPFLTTVAPAQQNETWTFAVSGDSRNCGDVVMPEIAQKVRADGAKFYWHLGDFRALYDFDEDMLAARKGKLQVLQYEIGAWPDFIDQQLAPFAEVPVYIALGNHENIQRSRSDALIQFADWFDSPAIRSQRLRDEPSDHLLRAYYHWHERNVDFITLDNSTPEQFDPDQVKWFERTLRLDDADKDIRTVVVGMHDALPDSLSAGHSMNESARGTESGRRVYADLLKFKRQSGKEVQVLASHSHFVMSNVYQTSCRKADDVLPGWIVGTAGATRYRLPAEHVGAGLAETDVYGYLLGSVDASGHVSFNFHTVTENDVSKETMDRYGAQTVKSCFEGNKGTYIPDGPVCYTK
jgi:hypothetical protein